MTGIFENLSIWWINLPFEEKGFLCLAGLFLFSFIYINWRIDLSVNELEDKIRKLERKQ